MSRGRRIEKGGSAYEAHAAWSAADGTTLCYFAALEDESGRGDRADRRALLESGESLSDLDDDRLGELLAEGAPLTATERRLETPDGGRWLAQSTGPVWAEGVAAGLTGVLFTDLRGSGERHRVGSGPIAGLAEDRLLRLWDEARAMSAEATDEPDGEEEAAPQTPQ